MMAFLFFLVLFSPMAIDIYLPALPVMAVDFGVSEVRVQDTITWYMLSFGLGQLVAGPLADRFGRRPIALAGIVLYGISSSLAYLAATLDGLLFARLLQGLAACATSVSAFACVRDCFGPEKSGKMISYLNGAICFIPALAPILGSYLTIAFGWRSNFSFMAGFAVVGLLFVALGFKETKPKVTPNNTTEKAPLFSLSRYVDVLKTPQFLFNAVLCMLAMAVILAYVTSAPMWMINTLGLTMENFTAWFSVNAALNILGGFVIAPVLMDKLGTRRALKAGLGMIVAGGFLMLLGGQTALLFMSPIFINSVGFALVLGACAGKALAPFGDKAGTAAALLGVFQMTGAGALVSVMQRLSWSAPELMALHMLLLLPALVMLMLPLGRQWHPVQA
uniref:multidrug effflux MFS transporter n=1 Tax=Thaumasiovibrio occultus TaxID=1891184 RepID=UPI000B35AE9E|nr:multidrug effflux MFS transporter [Thaumasiovibrio occultus]